MQNLKLQKILLSCFLAFLLLGGALVVDVKNSLAVGTLQSYLPNCMDSGPGSKGDCTVNDFVKIGIWVTQWILGISGSAALLMFVYGGIMMLISAGSAERVKQGQTILVNAVIGIVIVFAAYTIIGFVFKAMGVPLEGENNAWSKSDWFKN